MINLNWQEKIALVTGSDTRLGQAMATALAEAGADIVGASNVEAIKGSDTEAAITALGRKFKRNHPIGR